MREKLDLMRSVVSEVFSVTNVFARKTTSTYNQARMAFFWMARNFTDATLSDISEYSTFAMPTIRAWVIESDKMYWENKYYCRRICECLSKYRKGLSGIKKKKIHLQSITKGKVQIRTEIFMMFPNRAAVLLQTIINLAGNGRVEITNDELFEKVGVLSKRDFRKAYYYLRDKGVIDNISENQRIKSIKIIDEKVIRLIEDKADRSVAAKSNGEKVVKEKKIPPSVMNHVLALQKIRENKSKKFGV